LSIIFAYGIGNHIGHHLLDALAIPRQAFTPTFAVARAAGWTAHAREQQRTGRLIRPSSSYVGAMPEE